MRRFWTKLAIAFAILSPAFAMAGDQEVAQQIGQNLKNSGKLKGYSINVKVHEGVAQLNGTVSSAQQLDDALSIAEVTPGIERVVNNLSVKAPSAKPAAAPARLLCVNRRTCSLPSQRPRSHNRSRKSNKLLRLAPSRARTSNCNNNRPCRRACQCSKLSQCHGSQQSTLGCSDPRPRHAAANDGIASTHSCSCHVATRCHASGGSPRRSDACGDS